MKKQVIALAALAAGAAHAQTSVQFYGLVDAGVEYVNHANAAGDKVLRLTSGGQNTSRFGFRGVEDLGGGLKGVFNLEGGFFVDNGTIDGALFRRQANVGLEGAFGRLIAGRSYTTVYDFILPFDPMGYAPQYSWATTGNGTGASKYGMTTAFDNILKYQGQFGGVKVGASYGFGEVAGSVSDAAKSALGLGYTAGPLSLAATAEQVNGTPATGATTRSKTNVYHLGAGYQVSDVLAVKAGYRNYRQAPATGAGVRADTYWAGVNYQATPVIGLTGAVYYQNVKAGASAADTLADPMMFVLRAKYALSKRTDLYAVTAYAKAKNGQAVGLTRDSTADGGVTGFADRQTGVMVGVQHRF
ncbi:Outer membrane protein (porin) [Noviherbaspirillum humi]|uniref:Outer membrane protein (Porin) n=1 Tax=Noviherbaspirillum humi TaxID=1688639 RepID=A0A239KKB9_9BURK|nr:porin [Noviherbaspirillum humi]SNT18440.1 Outer membrane protein (porin) [Noviherbaspirillum humi]